MVDIVDNLLKTYYGFGREKAEEALSDCKNVIDKPNIFKKSIATEYIIDSSDENAGDNLCSTEANVSDDQANDDTEEKHIRSRRAIVDDRDINDDDIYVNGEELILNSKELNNDNVINNNAEIGVEVISPSLAREDVHDEPATVSQTTLGVLDVLVQENVSDNSLSLASKKKLKKKSGSTTLTQNSSLQSYPLQCTSPKQIESSCNGEFFDMSNASITRFPISLLDELQNIKVLYLENNALVHLPEGLFTKLNFLQWLDVRGNQLTTLPSTIKFHPSLETILLQANRIERLPLELSVVPHLETIQLQRNPLVYPPPDILAQGFKAIIKFLREQWNVEHPDEAVYIAEETKSRSTILNRKPSTVKRSLRSNKMPIITNSSSIILPKLKQTNSSIREKTWNYKPSNRCDNSERNSIMEAKLQWISKVKEKLNKQAAILQRVKDRDVLEKWRQDRRTFDQSIEKAANRTGEDIPYGVDYSDIPYLKQQQQSQNEKQVCSPKEDINLRMSEISTSLKELEIDKRSGKLNVETELKRLEVEIEKLSNLQRQIHNLNIDNETATSKYEDVNSKNIKQNYKAPPSIII